MACLWRIFRSSNDDEKHDGSTRSNVSSFKCFAAEIPCKAGSFLHSTFPMANTRCVSIDRTVRTSFSLNVAGNIRWYYTAYMGFESSVLAVRESKFTKKNSDVGVVLIHVVPAVRLSLSSIMRPIPAFNLDNMKFIDKMKHNFIFIYILFYFLQMYRFQKPLRECIISFCIVSTCLHGVYPFIRVVLTVWLSDYPSTLFNSSLLSSQMKNWFHPTTNLVLVEMI